MTDTPTLDVDRLRYLRTLQDQHDLQGLLPHQRIEEGTFDLHLVEGGRGCIAPGTRIYDPIADEHVPVEDWGDGHHVVTHRGNIAPASRSYIKGTAELYRVTLDSGRRVTVTDEHRFLTRDGWRNLQTIREGDTMKCTSTVLAPDEGEQFPQWWEPIEAIEPMGAGVFYDLTVPGDHSYLAEGIFHHNSAKSFGLSHYLARFMRRHAGARARIISPTLGDAIEALVEGPSGVKAADPSAKWLPSAPGGSKLLWANGSECLVLGTPTLRDVDRLRASGNRHLDIWDEAAANPCLDAAWKQADLGRRLTIDGIQPHSVMGTTPKPTKAYREIRAKAIAAGTYVHATMDDNPYLSDEWKAHMRELYGGTRVGRQEIGGELLEDIEGAMWTALLIDAGRVKKAPDMEKVVVGVDPSGGGPDDQGIIVAGKAAGHYYVLADYTCHLSPEGWGRRVLQAYDETNADLIVWEKNYGGEMVPATIRAAAVMAGRPCPPLKEVWASRGKRLRAEPIAALYGDRDHPETSEPRIHHVGALPRLEDEMLTFTGDSGEASPNRLDACVEALTDLIEATYAVGAVRVPGRDY